MQDQIGIACFFQRAFKSFDQMMGELSDKTDCIRQKDLLPSGKCQKTGRRIKCGEKLVLLEDICVRQRVEQR